MLASEVIALLQRTMEEHGDLPATVECDYGCRSGEVGQAKVYGKAEHGNQEILLLES